MGVRQGACDAAAKPISSTSVEPVVSNGAKTKPRQALKRSLRGFRFAQPLKMTFLTIATFLSLGIINESWAIDSYTYDDYGRISEISFNSDPHSKIKIIYDTKDNLEKIVPYEPLSQQEYGFTDENIATSGDNETYIIDRSLGYFVFDNKGKILQKKESNGPIETTYIYNYDQETGQKISRTTNICNLETESCESASTEVFSYQYDEFNNVIAEKIGDEVINTYSYSDAYLAKQSTSGSSQNTGAQPTAASCANDGKVLKGNACVSSCGSSFRLNDGECDRIRYTPAEAAQYLKDTDNEIIMTFKVNR